MRQSRIRTGALGCAALAALGAATVLAASGVSASAATQPSVVAVESAAPLYGLSGTWEGYAAGAPNSDRLGLQMDANGNISGTGQVSGESFSLGGNEDAGGHITLTLTQGAAQFPPNGYTSTDTGTVTQNGNCFSGTWSDTVGGPGHSGTFIWVRNGAIVDGSGTSASPYVCASQAAPTTPLPPPVLGSSENVTPVSGQVLIELPAGSNAGTTYSVLGPVAAASLTKGTGFIPLTEARQIPVNSVLDTTRGTVRIVAATATAGKEYTGDYSAGIFKLLQSRTAKGLSELDLMDTLNRAKVCASAGKGYGASAARKVSNKVLALLKGTDHGRFTTRGDYSASTVRGTQYSVENTCAGTLTKVARGIVAVDYFRRRKTVILHAGQSFLALASGGASKVVGKG